MGQQGDEPVRLTRSEKIRICLLTSTVVLSISQQHCISILVSYLFDAADNLGKEWIGYIGNQCDDYVRTRGAQHSSSSIRYVAEACHRLRDAGKGMRSHNTRNLQRP